MKLLLGVALGCSLIASATYSNDLKALKQGLYEQENVECKPRTEFQSGDFVVIYSDGESYSQKGVDCVFIERSESGGYNMKCLDWTDGSSSEFELKLKMTSETTFVIEDRGAFKWCSPM